MRPAAAGTRKRCHEGHAVRNSGRDPDASPSVRAPFPPDTGPDTLTSSRTKDACVGAGSLHVNPVAAIVVGLLGAAAIMVSPVTPWTMVLVIGGLAVLVPAVTFLIVWVLRHW
jgi:hypothetical protein